jgi:hypothetical protein
MSDEIKTKQEQVFAIKFTIGEDSYFYDGFDIYENLTNKDENYVRNNKGYDKETPERNPNPTFRINAR